MKVEGVSEAWLKQYGAKVLEKIDTFCQGKGEPVERDTFPVLPNQTQPQEQLIQVNSCPVENRYRFKEVYILYCILLLMLYLMCSLTLLQGAHQRVDCLPLSKSHTSYSLIVK